MQPAKREGRGVVVPMPSPSLELDTRLAAVQATATSSDGSSTLENRPQVLSVVVPVYNEDEAIPVFMKAFRQLRERLSVQWGMAVELVFVDDGSTDRTRAVLVELAQVDRDVVVVGLSRNFGKEVALSAGLAEASGEAVVPMDVDLQDPPHVVLEMVKHWREGWPIVQAVRSARPDDTFMKRWSAKNFYALIGRLSRVHIEPNAGDFQLVDRKPLNELLKYPERVRFMKGLAASVGYRRAKVYYERPARAAGTTKWNGWKLWNFALDGITGLTTLPLRVWTYVGVLVALCAFALAGYIVVQTLVHGVSVPGYASTTVLVLMLGGLNLVGLGVIGEYVGRVSIEVRGRPLYHVDLRVGQRNEVHQ